MKKTVSILGTLMFVALFIMNLSFFNKGNNNEIETFNSVIVTISVKAKATVLYLGYKKRFLLPGCKLAAGYVCD